WLGGRVRPAQNEVVFDSIERGLQAKWDAEVGILKESSEKDGKGQTKGVAKRLTSLVRFLEGEFGRRLRQAWLDWRSLRDNVRATFCTLIEGKLGELYTTDRRVRLLLGGPPCKGFSRVGRAKIAS